MREWDRWFVQGEIFWQTIDTAYGWMVLSAHVSINGARLTLSDFDCKPLHTKTLQIGVRESLALRAMLLSLARQEGYTTVVIDGIRRSGRSPNRPVHYERRLHESRES